jgi:hypothetical protein
MRSRLTGVLVGILTMIGGSTTVAWGAEAAKAVDQTFFWVTVLTGGFAMAVASAMAALAQAPDGSRRH